MKFTLKPGFLTYADLVHLYQQDSVVTLDPTSHQKIHAAEQIVNEKIAAHETIYGINTGFGSLAHRQIPTEKLKELQNSIILSHAAGTGDALADDIVKLILILKINSLARGYSGVRLATIEALIALFNHKIYPYIPCQGSVGASGDLAPLAHLSAVLLGEGFARRHGKKIPAKDALRLAGLKPITLNPKEGLALINGTQVSTALAIAALIRIDNIFLHGLISGGMTTDAVLGSDKPFDPRIQQIRGFIPQLTVADILRELLTGSEIRQSHLDCKKVQDPYSLRCQPQVMGACLTQILFASDLLTIEANAVTDNPLIFAEDNVILSGGNFHAEPVAMLADGLALAIAEIGSIAERRIALLMDPNFSNLPPFLVENSGLNSGFMIAQTTAAALASENKTYAHPASIDSIPTSANQEDHVSMATFAARRLMAMCENTEGIIAIELLAAAQGIDFRRPLRTSPLLEKAYAMIRQKVKFFAYDRFFAPDIATMKTLIQSGKLPRALKVQIFDLNQRSDKKPTQSFV